MKLPKQGDPSMSTTMKYQEQFAHELAQRWIEGQHEHVRLTIRGLKNKPQAAYIAAATALFIRVEDKDAAEFVAFIHPNNR
jgi:hypothetical protein